MTNFMDRMVSPGTWDAWVIVAWVLAAALVVLLAVLVYRALAGDRRVPLDQGGSEPSSGNDAMSARGAALRQGGDRRGGARTPTRRPRRGAAVRPWTGTAGIDGLSRFLLPALDPAHTTLLDLAVRRRPVARPGWTTSRTQARDMHACALYPLPGGRAPRRFTSSHAVMSHARRLS